MAAATDSDFMARALELARASKLQARPNPGVGCVLVRDGGIIAEGGTEPAGGPHAEIVALSRAGGAAAGATAYVTLEPCCHHGRTPPCTDALIAAGIAEVVYAAGDPNPLVGGHGRRALEKAGINVRSGVLETEAEAVNSGFACRMRTGRPRVIVKIAASLDGASAMADGESQWITSEAARADVQVLRAAAGAILTGSGTVAADDPLLSVRDRRFERLPAQPLRVVLDSRLITRADARVCTGGRTVIFTVNDAKAHRFDANNVEVKSVPPDAAGKPSLDAVFSELARREINDVLVEAGARLCGRLIEQDLVDEFVFYIAPKLLGSNTRRLFETPGILSLADAELLELIEVTLLGPDIRITARPAGRKDARS